MIHDQDQLKLEKLRNIVRRMMGKYGLKEEIAIKMKFEIMFKILSKRFTKINLINLNKFNRDDQQSIQNPEIVSMLLIYVYSDQVDLESKNPTLPRKLDLSLNVYASIHAYSLLFQQTFSTCLSQFFR